MRAPVAALASAAIALVAAPATAGAVHTATAPQAGRGHGPAHSAHADRKGWYDAQTASPRVTLQRAAEVKASQERAVSALRDSLGTQSVVSIDPFTHTPRNVAKLDGFLTRPSSEPAARVAMDYVRAHTAVFGMTPAAVRSLQLRKDYVDALGTHHLSWQMMVKGVPVFGNGLRAHVTRDGRLLAVQGSPLASVPALSVDPRLSAARARSISARDVGGHAARAQAQRSGGPRLRTTWKNDDSASLVVYMTPGGARLGWLTYVQAGTNLNYLHVLDAASGKVLYRSDLTARDNGDPALVYENYPGAAQGGTPKVVDFAGKGWLSGKADILFGPNAYLYSDLNDDNQAQNNETVPAPKGSTPKWPLVPFTSSSLCDAQHPCTWDPAERTSWQTNRKQDGTQAFFFVNNWHDHLLAPPISFTPEAGNFELGGGDPVVVNTMDGANTAKGLPDLDHIDNANMSTPPDGYPPLMQMYLFHAPGYSDTDEPFVPTSGAEESDIVYHEYTHGLSNRLVVDSNGAGALNSQQSGAMGEAWSDWYAFDYLVDQGLQPDTAADGEVRVGDYVGHGQDLIRTQPLDCPVGSSSQRCPGTQGAGPGGYTYGDFGRIIGTPEVHADGEIWGETLWDLRDAIGSRTAEMLVTRAMELSPAEPSYLDMRNAILQADLVSSAGSDQDTIWRVFAHRGMGWYAGSLGGSDTRPAEDFSVPPTGEETGTLTGTVTDATTGEPVAGATVTIAGHEAGSVGDYTTTTGDDGRYTLEDVVPGTYPKVALVAPGYEYKTQEVTVSSGTTTQDFQTRRDWASGLAGGTIADFNGPDYTDYGCGPGGAIDQSQGTGWGSTTGDGSLTGTMLPKHITVKLPKPVDVTSFEVDPSATCGDPGSSSTGKYSIETSPDGSSWTAAAQGEFTAANRGRYNVVTPTAGTAGVQYVRFTILGPQVPDFENTCPTPSYGGCTFTDMTELEVFGTAAH